MANNSNVSYSDYPYDSLDYALYPDNNANIDANYGPWISTNAYETWLYNTVGGTPKEGTLIAVQPTEHADVTLYVYTSNVGEGTWKPVGSGGTGADDIGYVTDNVEVQLLNKQIVSTSANQGLNLEQQAHARTNINAADADNVIPNGGYLCTINNTRINQGAEVTLQGIDSGGSSQPSISIRDNVVSNNSDLVKSSGIYTFVTNQLASKAAADAEALAEKADKTELSGKADKGSTLSEYGISNAYTKTETNTAISDALGDYVKKNNAQVTGNLSVNGSTTLGDSTSDTLNVNGDATITGELSALDDKITAALSEGQNPVAVLTVDGDVTTGRTFTQTLQVHNSITLGTATTQSQTSNSSTVINGGLTLADITANGILKLDGNKKVISDTGTYMKFRSEVNTFDDLSNSSGTIAVGDVFYIKDTDSQVVATEITSDKNLRVIYSTDVNVTLNTDSEGTTPILSTSDFFSAFSTDGAFDAYPTFAYTYHKIYYNGSNVGDLKIVPVRTSEYGIIIALVSVTASKAWAASTTYDGGERNVWYIEGMLSNGSGVVELDVTHSTIPSGRNIKEFVVFGGGVTWKSIGRKTTNIINMIPITEDTEYAEIESILLAGNIPYLYSMDSNCKYGNQYRFCGGYTANSIDYYTFESVTYDNGSFKKVIKICEEATDPTWTTKTVTLTIDA